jgi:hypothetical protein
MTQEIKPTYVTREQANRLKEKEFDLPTYAYYSGLNFYTGEYKNHSQTTIGDTPMHKMLIGYTSAPEQWQVVEWLRVNHGIWINIEPEEYGQYYYVKLNVCSQELWEDLDKRHEVITAHRKFNNEHKTPQEAYSAAFDYILNDLI